MTFMVLADKYYADGKVGDAYRYRERAVYYDACPNPEYYDPVMRYSHMDVVLLTYPIMKFTPKGFWIYCHGEKKFVLKDGRKKFAALTKLEAMESFIARKIVHVSFAAKRLQRAEDALKVGDKMLAKMKEEIELESRRQSEGAGVEVPQEEPVRPVREAEAQGHEVL